MANYYGGSGNDLVLVWANNRAFAWGRNNVGQIGDNTTTERHLPVAVPATGVLAGTTVLATAAGVLHSLALCADGSVAAWGDNEYGELGDNTTTNRLVPVIVNTAAGVSAIYGKSVVAIAAGEAHNLALCSDGTVAAWGINYDGQLGDNTVASWPQSAVPVAVNRASGVSALYGRTVVAISAGASHSVALCSDGSVAAWGGNSGGQLGDNTKTDRSSPVAVNTAAGVSALYGKTVVAIAAGAYHSVALCSDNALASWGRNYYGHLGDNTKTDRSSPVAVSTTAGVSALYGKTVVAIAAGAYHNVALCSDGTLASWGYNEYGQLGDNTTTNRLVPVAVNRVSGVSALYGKAVVAIAAGSFHSVALCSDGTLAAWGYNTYGQLGDNTTTNRLVPVAVNPSSLATGERFSRVSSGLASHTLALGAASPAPGITLTGTALMPDGSFRFAFSNGVGALFSVLATTNLSLPLSNWTILGGATEVSSGQYLFTDTQATNNPRRFYRVRSP